MGIFSRTPLATALALQQPIVAPGSHQYASPWQDDSILTRLTLSQLFGTEHMTIDRQAALTVSAISRGRNLITQQAARFPLQVVKAGLPVPGQPAWATQLEAGRSRISTMTWIYDALLFFGRAYLLVADTYATTYPARFTWVPEWQAKTDGAGMLIAVGDHKVKPGEWLRIDGPTEGILATATEDIRDAITLKRATARAYRNPVPSIVLQQRSGSAPIPESESKALVNAWMEARQSERGQVAFASAGIEPTAMGQQPEQLMIAARTQSALDLARAMNLPAWSIDVSIEGSDMNYSNVPGRARELLAYTLQPYVDAVLDRLSMPDVLPAGQSLTALTSAMTASDFNARMQGYQYAIAAGVYTADECRLLEAGQPVPFRGAPEPDPETPNPTTPTETQNA